MDKPNDIRWQQRFQNFNKAFQYLKDTLTIKEPSDAERAGIIQFYEVAFELAWKTLKDFLTAEGFSVKSPREALKTAFQNDYINNGDLWINALDSRNLSAHTYDEAMAKELVENIKTIYFPLLEDFDEWGKQQINE
ncbi:nucleotidyltransferase substrate binding protein [Anaerophaga thermohalophila]|uniref:nucleotidyltransferase substrate binding protein n=1 Tax=Anaerophaga thermohalophila TaxID=177400 RepID=UPI000237D3A9|nr:nucleotidyltransferase substrate binding protein [Anaerophaga thermohalophila]